MYVINQNPKEVIPDISENFIYSKFIILIAERLEHHVNYHWIALLDLLSQSPEVDVPINVMTH